MLAESGARRTILDVRFSVCCRYVLLRGAVVVSKVPSRYAELQHQKRSIEQQVRLSVHACVRSEEDSSRIDPLADSGFAPLTQFVVLIYPCR